MSSAERARSGGRRCACCSWCAASVLARAPLSEHATRAGCVPQLGHGIARGTAFTPTPPPPKSAARVIYQLQGTCRAPETLHAPADAAPPAALPIRCDTRSADNFSPCHHDPTAPPQHGLLRGTVSQLHAVHVVGVRGSTSSLRRSRRAVATVRTDGRSARPKHSSSRRQQRLDTSTGHIPILKGGHAASCIPGMSACAGRTGTTSENRSAIAFNDAPPRFPQKRCRRARGRRTRTPPPAGATSSRERVC